jgi:hypothetical protein
VHRLGRSMRSCVVKASCDCSVCLSTEIEGQHSEMMQASALSVYATPAVSSPAPSPHAAVVTDASGSRNCTRTLQIYRFVTMLCHHPGRYTTVLSCI